MKLSEIVKGIINGSLSENELLNLAKRKKLPEVYERKTLLDYILEYKRNTEEFDKFSVYNSEIAIKYLDYGLSPNIDSEEIFMSKYDEEKTIFEKYIGKYFDASFLNIITNLIKDGRNLKEILLCKIDNKYVFEHLEEKGLNTIITYMLVANANKKDLVNVIVNGKSLLEYLYENFVNNEKYSLKSRKKFIESLRKKADSKDENSIFIAKMAFKYGDFATTLKNESFLLQKDKLSGESYLDIIIKELLQNNSIETIISINSSTRLLTYKSKYLGNKRVIEYIIEDLSEKLSKRKIHDKLFVNVKSEKLKDDESAYLFEIFIERYANSVDISKLLKIFPEELLLKNRNTSERETYLDLFIKKLCESDSALCIPYHIKYTAKLLTYKSKYLDNKMIIEYILDNFKEKFRKNYITTEILLYYIVDGGIILLDFLVKKYRDFVIELAKDASLFRHPAIISILGANGIDINELNFVGVTEYADLYLGESLEEYGQGISREANFMIDEFYDLLLKNGDNDKHIIELACLSFARQFATGFEYAYRDLQTMIELVKNRGLRLRRYDTSHFSLFNIKTMKKEAYISVSAPSLFSDFNHEMTHALHYLLQSGSVPTTFEKYNDLIFERIEKIFNFNKNFLKSLECFGKDFMRILDGPLLGGLYYIDYKETIMKCIFSAQKDIEIPTEYLLSIILSESKFRTLFEKEVKSEIMFSVFSEKFDVEFMLADMFDALSKGEFHTNGIEFNGEHYATSGHGIEYFKRIHPFVEILADYGGIIKSPRKEYGLTILKDVMGQEFIDMLDEFYANMYLKDFDYKIEGESYGL